MAHTAKTRPLSNSPVVNSQNWHDLWYKNFLVVGLARNCSKSIKRDVSRLSIALRNCPNLNWLIIESDSNDGTVEKIRELELETKNFRFLSLGVLRETFPLRTERIAYCRNKYLDEINHNAMYKDIDYVIVADLDELNSLITEEAFLSCWTKNDWDVCTANQRGPYYDIWALRHPDWSPNDCWSQYRFLRKNNLGAEQSLFVAVHSKMIVIEENVEWIEVDSAFGGLAIYRKEALSEAQYVGLNKFGEELCEHVTFHKKLKMKGCRIFINPKFVNAAYTEHTVHLLLLPRIMRMFKNTLKAIIKGLIGTNRFDRVKLIVAKSK